MKNARDGLRDALLELAWAQWTDLGVAGTRGSGRSIVDPEALIVATLDIGRYDPRLFDEMLDWLTRNDDLLDVTRLRRLIRDSEPETRWLARALIDFMRQSASTAKWSPFAERWQANENPAPYAPHAIFLDSDDSELPVFGEIDPFFSSRGLIRAPLRLRGMSRRPHRSAPALMRLAARSLTGTGVRAEVLLYLWTHEMAHGRLIATRSSYSQRQVSEYLAGLAEAGFAERFEVGTSVQYRLAPRIRHALPDTISYVDWAHAFEALIALYRGAAQSAVANTPYETSARMRSALTQLQATLPIEGLDLPMPRPDDHPGEALLSAAAAFIGDVAGAVRNLAGVVED